MWFLWSHQLVYTFESTPSTLSPRVRPQATAQSVAEQASDTQALRGFYCCEPNSELESAQKQSNIWFRCWDHKI